MLPCSHCRENATDYDVLFNPWCDACKIRKWLVNWGAQHQWLDEQFIQLNKAWSPTKEQWVTFAQTASYSEVERLWLRIALFEKKMQQTFLGVNHPRLSLPPPDHDTVYEQTVFRNEWEAKWACFFNSARIGYEYQHGITHEAHSLPTSTVFWLPDIAWYQYNKFKAWDHVDIGAYFIVTGPTPQTQEQERYHLACEFAVRTHMAVYLLEGRVGLSTHWDGVTVSRLDPSGLTIRPLNWFECVTCGAVGLFHPLSKTFHFCACVTPRYRRNTPRLLHASVVARYKRFGDIPELQAASTSPVLLS